MAAVRWTRTADATHHGGVRAIAWWNGLSRRRRMLVAVLALVVVAGGVAGTVRALAGGPRRHQRR